MEHGADIYLIIGELFALIVLAFPKQIREGVSRHTPGVQLASVMSLTLACVFIWPVLVLFIILHERIRKDQ